MDSSQPVAILSVSEPSEEEEEEEEEEAFVHVGAGKKIYSNLKRKKDNDFILLCMCLL